MRTRDFVAVFLLTGLLVAPVRETVAETRSRPRRTRQVISAEIFGRHTGVVSTQTCVKDRKTERCRYGLYLTRDLGKTWRDVTPPQLDRGMSVNDVFFLDRRRGWVNASEPCTVDAVLARTTDGGRTWRSTEGDLLACHAGAGIVVDFVDGRHGFLDSWVPDVESSNIKHSRDGGRSWSKGRNVRPVGPLAFRDRRHGYIATDVIYGHQLYSSNDAGESWKRRFARRPSGSHARMIYDLPTFVGGRRILPVTMREDGREDLAFYSNAIGPGAWRLASIFRARLNARHQFVGPIPSSVASPTSWWALYGRGGNLAITRNGGESWTTRDVDLRGSPSAISAIGGRTAWATTYDDDRDRFLLYATRNGGRTWRRLRPWR